MCYKCRTYYCNNVMNPGTYKCTVMFHWILHIVLKYPLLLIRQFLMYQLHRKIQFLTLRQDFISPSSTTWMIPNSLNAISSGFAYTFILNRCFQMPFCFHFYLCKDRFHLVVRLSGRKNHIINISANKQRIWKRN